MNSRDNAGKTVGMVMTRLTEVVHVDLDMDEAKARMEKLKIPLLPVVDGEEVIGVLTDSDIASSQNITRDRRRDRVGNHVSTEISFCFENDPVETAIRVMEESGHPRLLVINEKDKLVGVVTRGSIGEWAHHSVPNANAEELTERTAQGPGRDTGGESGGPRSYSVKPVIRHNN